MQNKDVRSALVMESLLFEKILFQRTEFSKSNSDLELEFHISYQKKKSENLYKVTLGAVGTKKEEYNLEIQLLGVFSIDKSEEDDAELENTLIKKNAVAIMMPYLRSQMTLLTSQPGVESVVLPPFNIIKMIENED